MPASYPSSAKTFTTKSDGAGNTIQAAHVNDLQLEVTALEQDLIAGLPVARGGTGATSLTANRVAYTNGAGTALTSSANLTFDGTTLAVNGNTTLGDADTDTLTITAKVASLIDASHASGGQIKFPATQNASADSNTLDDYEEGTWTPVIGGSGGTSGQAYTTQVGRYVKIGKQVTCWFNVVLSTKGTITDNAQIQGLPFTVENTTNQIAAGIISDFANMATNVIYLSLVASPNTTAATIKGTTAAVASTGTLTGAGIDNTTQLVGCISFTASA